MAAAHLSGRFLPSVSSLQQSVIRFRSTLSMKAMRRTLEEQLGLEEKHLDNHKDLVTKLVDEVLT